MIEAYGASLTRTTRQEFLCPLVLLARDCFPVASAGGSKVAVGEKSFEISASVETFEA